MGVATRDAERVSGGGSRGAEEGVTATLPELDLAIMNPPFTRSVGGNLLFGSLPATERRKLQNELLRRLKQRQAPATAGLGAAFVAAASPKLRPGEGRLALVLPATVCTGPSWEQTRSLIERNFAMRLAGSTFSRSIEQTEPLAHDVFDDILKEATELLGGRNAPPGEADEQRDRLLAGFRWILVDEYQDIKELEYNLISALAGRTKTDQDQRLNLFAVGDDDQNIYAFSGSSSQYIKLFEEDYRARPSYLTENYRSTGHIIAVANSVIEPANLRMKADHPITVNRSRARERLGGAWERMDPVTLGRVQILPAGDNPFSQAQVVLQELKRMASLDPAWDWSACAVVARNWDLLDPVRALCHSEEIPVQVSREDFTATWQLRETQALLDWTKGQGNLMKAEDLLQWLHQQP